MILKRDEKVKNLDRDPLESNKRERRNTFIKLAKIRRKRRICDLSIMKTAWKVKEQMSLICHIPKHTSYSIGKGLKYDAPNLLETSFEKIVTA